MGGPVAGSTPFDVTTGSPLVDPGNTAFYGSRRRITVRGRPLSIVILTIIVFIMGVVVLLVGAAAVIIASSEDSFFGEGGFGGLLQALGAIVMGFGILFLLIAYGIWAGNRLVWLIGVIFSALLVLATPLCNIPCAVVGIALLWYFFTPHVRDHFRINI